MNIVVTMLFWRNSPPFDYAANLRGSKPLRALGMMPNVAYVEADAENKIQLYQTDTETVCVTFADLQLLVEMPALLEGILNLDHVLIVDVHFPYGQSGINALQPGRDASNRDPFVDSMAAKTVSEDWMAKASMVLSLAHAITVPKPEWAKKIPMREDQAIIVLPDASNPESSALFTQRFFQAVQYAESRAHDDRLPRLHERIFTWVTGWLMGRRIRRILRHLPWTPLPPGI